MPRACVIVLDAVGAGELPDASDYGDEGSDTLGNVAKAVRGLDLPNLEALGLGNVEPLEGCRDPADRKSTRLNSSYSQISYAVFCLKKKNFQSCCCCSR